MRFLQLPLAMVVFSAAAFASPLTWTLSGLTFNDGGTASGTFVYDADTEVFSSIDITTTAGTIFPGGNYSELAQGLASDPNFVALQTTTPQITLFTFEISAAMTDSGGTLALDLDPLSEATAGEENCFNATCSLVFDSPNRFSVNGSVSAPTSQVVSPEPASVALLACGLGFLASRRLAGAGRKQR